MIVGLSQSPATMWFGGISVEGHIVEPREAHIWILLYFDDEENLGRKQMPKDKISRVT